MQLWCFRKRLLKVHVHGSGGDKDIPRVVTWALSLLVMVHGIVMYRR